MSTISSDNKRIARNTAFLYFRMGIVMLVALYTTRVVLRVLGIVDYGIYNVVCGFVSMFGILNTSLNTGTNRFYNFALGRDDTDEFGRVYNASIRIQGIILAILLLLLETLGVWYINHQMVIPPERLMVANIIFQFSVLSLAMLMLEIPYTAAIMAHERMDFYAMVSIIDVSLKLFFVIVLQWIDKDKLLVYGCLMTIISVINFSFYYLYCRKKFKYIRFSRTVDKTIFKSLMSFSAWSLLDPFTRMAQGQGSNMVLNLFFGPVVNAAQGVATQISNAVDRFTQNIAVAFRPQITQSYSSGDWQRTKSLMYSMSRINFMLHAIIAASLIFELPYLLGLWLGDSYPYYTIPFASLILIIRTIDCLHAPISAVMVATGKIKKVKTVSMFIICSIIPLSYFSFKAGWEPTLLYAILLVLSLANVIVSALIMCEKFPTIQWADYSRKILLPCAAFGLLVLTPSFIITRLFAPSLPRLLFSVLITMMASVFMLYYLFLNASERELALSILAKVRGKANKVFRKNK